MRHFLMDKKELLRNIAAKSDVDLILITDPFSLRYYTGFRGGEGIALVTPASAVLITDSRYTEAAGKESDFEVIEYNNSNPLFDIINGIMDKDQAFRIGIDDRSMTYSDFHKYRQMLKSAKLWIALDAALLKPRQIKSPEEIATLRKAESIGDKAFSDILNIIKPGMTELEVAMELEYAMKKNGANGFSFDTIAASGLNSSMPHAIPSEKKIENGDFLTMDFGCLYDGYCSDMTRTICVGKASQEQKDVYQIVLDAHLQILEKMKPGMVCKDVDSIARSYISDKGFGAYFGHGLGHSVGLYIHESPALNTRDMTILRSGMIETDEPGIYLPGKFGVRIEDMCLITEDGCESLASSPKELIEL